MKVILHAGAHCTDDDRLMQMLLRNAHRLRRAGTAIPKPSSYRKLLSATMNALNNAAPAEGATEVFLDAIMREDRQPVERLILSHESFFTVPKQALGDGVIYPRAAVRLRNMQKLFRGHEVELFLGLRNPATWLQAVYSVTPHQEFLSFLSGCDPERLRWSELIHRMREASPSVQITVWCNEDTPLIWEQLARVILALPPDVPLDGAFDLLEEVMSEDGMRRFRSYLEDHPNISAVQTQRVTIAFLEKFALQDVVEEELDLPGWTDAYVQALTDAYDADVDEIASMEGVQVIAP